MTLAATKGAWTRLGKIAPRRLTRGSGQGNEFDRSTRALIARAGLD